MKKLLCLFASLAVALSLSSCGRIRVQEGGSLPGGSGSASSSSSSSQGDFVGEENTIGETGGDIALLEGDYEGLLREGLGDLYPCQYVLVYAEDELPFTTFSSSSAVNALLLACGGDSITSSFFSLDGAIDPSLVNLYSPELIVKWVGEETLGVGVKEPDLARACKRELLSRAQLKETPASKTGSVVVLAKSLLHSEKGKTVAKLVLAKQMYPTLFPEIDLAAVASELLGEGLFFFS